MEAPRRVSHVEWEPEEGHWKMYVLMGVTIPKASCMSPSCNVRRDELELCSEVGVHPIQSRYTRLLSSPHPPLIP